MGTCIRTLGVLTDGALWNVYIQTLAIINKTADQYYARIYRSFFIFIELTWTKCLNKYLEPNCAWTTDLWVSAKY